MKLSDIADNAGSRKKRMRVGRGILAFLLLGLALRHCHLRHSPSRRVPASFARFCPA